MLKNFRRKDLCRSLQLSQIITVQFSGKNKDTILQCSGSVTFWYGSVDPYRWVTVYGYSDPDPALFFKDKKLLVRRAMLWKSRFFLIFCLLVEGSGAGSVQIIIREAQKLRLRIRHKNLYRYIVQRPVFNESCWRFRTGMISTYLSLILFVPDSNASFLSFWVSFCLFRIVR